MSNQSYSLELNCEHRRIQNHWVNLDSEFEIGQKMSVGFIAHINGTTYCGASLIVHMVKLLALGMPLDGLVDYEREFIPRVRIVLDEVLCHWEHVGEYVSRTPLKHTSPGVIDSIRRFAKTHSIEPMKKWLFTGLQTSVNFLKQCLIIDGHVDISQIN